MWHRVQNREFLEMIWGWDWWLQNLFLDCHLIRKNKPAWNHALLWEKNIKISLTFFLRSLQVKNHGVMDMILKWNNNQANERLQHPPRLKKAHKVRLNIKTMFICFFVVRGVVHSKFVPSGQTANQAFYLEVLKR